MKRCYLMRYHSPMGEKRSVVCKNVEKVMVPCGKTDGKDDIALFYHAIEPLISIELQEFGLGVGEVVPQYIEVGANYVYEVVALDVEKEPVLNAGKRTSSEGDPSIANNH